MKKGNLEWPFKDLDIFVQKYIVYRTENDLNPSYMKNAFKKSDTLRSKRPHHQYNLIVPRPNYYEFNTTILTAIGQNFGILFLLILSSQKHLQCLKNPSKHEMEKCVSAVCAHAIRIIK